MSKHIFPDSHANRLAFLKQFKTELATDAPSLNLDPALLATMNAMLNALIAKYQTLVDAEAAVAVASADAAGLFLLDEPALRGFFNSLKTNPSCTPGMQQAMGIAPDTSAHA